MKSRITRTTRRSAALAAALLAVSALIGIAAAPAQAATGCEVRFRPNTWTVDADDQPNYVWNGTEYVWNGVPTAGIGFVGDFTVTNTGDPITGWTAMWFNPPATRLVGNGLFNATLVRRLGLTSFTVWMVKAPAWNADLRSGGTATFGYQGVVPDPTLDPAKLLTTFRLSGRTCTIVS
jgi:Cellulose binding domain